MQFLSKLRFILSYRPESIHLELWARQHRSEKHREKQLLPQGAEKKYLCAEKTVLKRNIKDPSSSFRSSLETNNEEEHGTRICRENTEFGKSTELLIIFITLSPIPVAQAKSE